MTPLPTIRPLLGLILIALAPASAAAGVAPQGPVTLTGWAGPAMAIDTNRGPGEALFLLPASVRWRPEASRERDRYQWRITLPGGRVERRPLLPTEGPPAPVLSAPVPAGAVRNLRPEAVRVEVALIDPVSGALRSNPLVAGIDQFPSPSSAGGREPSGPFSWGRPLEIEPGGAGSLPNPGPDGWRFVRVAGTPDRSGFFIAATEATNRQVAERLPGFDPNAGRSDEFSLDAPDQPAINLTPDASQKYLGALTENDPAGVTYRLPTRSEWEVAARAGRDTEFWWGNVPVFPEGANFLGPEPGEESDTTVPPTAGGGAYGANQWGLRHSFGNVAEWASAGEDGGSTFVRMGGHFRTEPGAALDPTIVDDPASTGPDPFVGVRPAFTLDAEAGAALIRAVLDGQSGLEDVAVAFDPDRATSTLSGTVAGEADRKRALEALRPLWFLAAAVDEIRVPSRSAGRLASIGAPTVPASPVRTLGRRLLRLPLPITWHDPLPVIGSDWWLNVYGPTGAHFAHRLGSAEPGRPTVLASIPVDLLGPGRTARVALSLGTPAGSTSDAALVTDIATVTVGP
ncbi:SUMF1/EgtB/PvdO family nonheme iron enzyme [Tautonia sociabilis]|uniref:SUMF1/EgtB/PvdO family nonheme iron enzyme n=1 Tax=Tautonia sociabilis TaxID=2080755 RepID=UPI0013151450|nr:SUMF1/EgtB/PvdO family nonheme iron enzyme [Tautonia sociabilis]